MAQKTIKFIGKTGIYKDHKGKDKYFKNNENYFVNDTSIENYYINKKTEGFFFINNNILNNIFKIIQERKK